MKSLFSFTVLFLSLLATLSGSAQHKLQKLQTLDSIVVQNQRLQIPFSRQNRDIRIIDRAVIESMPVKSVNELLSYVAGIDVRSRGPWGAQADISINGGTFDETLVLLNGMKLIDQQTGHNMMNLPVDLDAIERIEILQGPAASAYGVNAITGAINIITRQPDKTGFTAHVFGGSSFKKDSATGDGHTSGGVSLTASLAAKKARHFFSASTIQSNGYRYNTALNNDKFFYSNNLQLGKNSLQMMGGFLYNDFGANAFYAAPNDTEAQEKVQTAIASIQANLRLTPSWTMRPALSYRYNFDDYILVRQKPETYENRHYTGAIEASLNNSFYTTAGTFGLGLVYRQASINSNSLGDHQRTNLGLIANYSLDFIPRLLVNAGLYTHYSDDFGWNVMPSIDAGYQIHNHLRLFAAAGTGMRLPTYTDWYYKGPVNIGNDQLEPEKSWQTTGGIKYNTARFNASASYFYRDISAFIDWVKVDPSDPWQPRNFQHIKTQGLSVSADYRVSAPEAADYSLLLGLSYTWLHPKATQPASQGEAQLISQYALENLRNQLNTRVTLRLFQHFGLTLSGKYQQRVSYKDYFLLAARLSADVHAFQFYMAATNLTNVTYIEAGAIPMPGRWFTLGCKIQLWK